MITANTQDLLVEIGTEELPPKSLTLLSEAFLDGICYGLEKHNLNYRIASPYATPRRLAVIIQGVSEQQAEQKIERKGPALKAAYDKDGNPSKAALGFARSCGVDVNDLEKVETPKGTWLIYKSVKAGKKTTELLTEIIQNSLNNLPISKRMRWSDLDFEFVRPIHWIVLLFGKDVVETEILGIKTGRKTYGHRFHAPEAIEITEPSVYSKVLEKQGHVLPVFSIREKKIVLLAEEAAELHDGYALYNKNLLAEVTNLVEFPVVVVGEFDKKFLEVPAEALISAMQGHQKYFPITDKKGNLLNKFITFSNIDSKNLDVIKAGNERVIRPRLSDAMFFWQQDCKHSLESRLEKLKSVTFEYKLGSNHAKSLRVSSLAGNIASKINLDENLAKRAGLLIKCDLLTNMVGEFPDLQGIMGEYYALNDGENKQVAQAIKEHYQPRFSSDKLPKTELGQIVALADRLDTLVGIFGIGKLPTGDKDPYALRRAAIGILRILIEQKNNNLDLKDLIIEAFNNYQSELLSANTVKQVLDFILERLRYYYQDKSVNIDIIDAVLSPSIPNRNYKILDIDKRIDSVTSFCKLEAATSLASANKRIHNLLKKSKVDLSIEVNIDELTENIEILLYYRLEKIEKQIKPYIENYDYSKILEILSLLRENIDELFDSVMIMDKDISVRNNRLALLCKLRNLFLQVADISLIQSQNNNK
jgi:glycyl-tRNA synthetase beta chain